MYKKILNGIFYQTEYYDKPLANMPYAQAGIVTRSNGDIMLKSYATYVCKIDAAGWLQCKGIYSRTTTKHIGAFTKEYTGNNLYYTCKALAQEGKAYNINTGEYRDLTENYDIYGFAQVKE